MPTQLSPCVVQRLVERAAVAAQSLGEYVDGHAVQGERDEDTTLVRGQDVRDRPLEGREQLALLDLLVGLDPRAREQAPRLRLQRHLSPLPRPLPQLDRGL